MEENKKNEKMLEEKELEKVNGGCRTWNRRYTGDEWKCTVCGKCCSCSNPYSIDIIENCKNPNKHNCNK